MIRWEAAYRRAFDAKHPLLFVGGPAGGGRVRGMTDFRSLHYVQPFTNVAMGVTTGYQLQSFPAGAFVLGIAAAATFNRVVKADQYYADGATAPLDSTFDRIPSSTPGNRDLFALDFNFTQDESITPNGPALAEALLGSGGGTEFPAREIVVDPSQGILCRVQSLLGVQLISGAAGATGIAVPMRVHVVYKCMVPRAVG